MLDLAATLKCFEKTCIEEGGIARGMVTESVFVVQSKMTESATDKTLRCPERVGQSRAKPLSRGICRPVGVGGGSSM